ncbi:MAG: hypothetical protein KatS3mg102_1791 [Planctomycetota bacterium]|nr:MAG: hypothetical protein KatS3mg102_1791 [Planctomycetota bacterium]
MDLPAEPEGAAARGGQGGEAGQPAARDGGWRTWWVLGLHALVIAHLCAEIAYTGTMVLVVLAPPDGGIGPLGARARAIPWEEMVTRRMYALECWVATAGLAVYLAVTEIGPRLWRARDARRGAGSSAAGAGGAGVLAVLLVLALAMAAGAQQPGGAAAGDGLSPAGFIEMPPATDGSYTLASGPGSGRHWGRPETIRFLILAAREWARRHPDGPRLHIGDISRPDGGPFPPHKTHRDGLAIDLFTRPRNICHVDWPEQNLTIELAELLEELGARQILYNGEQAGQAVRIVEPYPKHDDHFHVVVDPRRVPAALGPVLMAAPALKDGGAVGPAAFGPPGQRPPRAAGGPAGAAPAGGLRLEWRYLGEASGWQQSYRVELEAVATAGEGALRFDSDEVRSRRTWHLVEGEFRHGMRLRWRVEVTGVDGSRQDTGWQAVRLDFEPPRLSALGARLPEDGSGEGAGAGDGAGAAVLPAGSRPEFRWRYQDEAPQRSWRIELRRPRARRGAVLAQGLGAAERARSEHPLPPGTYEWRVAATDAAGNEASSDWVRLEVR